MIPISWLPIESVLTAVHLFIQTVIIRIPTVVIDFVNSKLLKIVLSWFVRFTSR